jgi:hypothetical protein
MKIFKIFRNNRLDLYDVKFSNIETEILKLKSENKMLRESIDDINIFNVIGLPVYDTTDRRLTLLREAKKRGFFDEFNYFIDSKGFKYKHNYSNISDNYRYWSEKDTLSIPFIGKGGDNCSAGCMPIYTNGQWLEVKTITDEKK